MENNNHPYYDRPSKETSYRIAVYAMIGMIVGGLLMTAWKLFF